MLAKLFFSHSSRSLSAYGFWVCFARFVVIATIMAAPWLFGSVSILAQVYIHIATFTALSAWFILTFLDEQSTWRFPLAALPLLGGLLLAIVQLVPLPVDSPPLSWTNSGRLRSVLMPETDTKSGLEAKITQPVMPVKHYTMTLYPAATRKEITLLVLATSVFLLGSRLFAKPIAFVWLCAAMAVNGTVLTLFALVQKFTWNGNLYWVYSSPHDSVFGPFIYHNQASNFLAVCFIGNLIWLMYLFRDYVLPPSQSANSLRRNHWNQLRQKWVLLFSNLNGVRLAALGMIVCNITGILATLSRGAFISVVLGITLVCLTMLVIRKNYSQFVYFGLGASVALPLIVWIGMLDIVTGRLSTLLESQTVFAAAPRIEHWKASYALSKQFWVAGSGLGTYRYISRLPKSQNDDLWWVHAHNQYLEAMSDGGVISVCLLFAIIALIGSASLRLLKSDDRNSRLLGVAGLLVLTIQVVHAVGEFVLYLPANMLITAALSGAIASHSVVATRSGQKKNKVWKKLTVAIVASLLLSTIWCQRELIRNGRVTAARKAIPWGQQKQDISSKLLNQRIRELELSLRLQPDNALGHYALAQLLMLRYSVLSYEIMIEETDSQEDQELVWNLSSLLVLHQKAHSQDNDDRKKINQIYRLPSVQKSLLPAVNHLHLARDACPLLAWVHLGLAEISFLPEELEDDQVHIKRARMLAPGDVNLLYHSGKLDYFANRFDDACINWKKCLELSPRHLTNIFNYTSSILYSSELITRVFPDSPKLIVQIVKTFYTKPAQVEDRGLLLRHARRLIEQEELPPHERYYLIAQTFELQGDIPRAIEEYRQAILLNSTNYIWRRNFAFLLFREGLSGEAEKHAIWCLRSKPNNQSLKRFLEKIRSSRKKSR